MGNARGMSIRVSTYLLPGKFFLTISHAIGIPTITSMIVTMNAMLNELPTAPHITAIFPESEATPLIRSHWETASKRT